MLLLFNIKFSYITEAIFTAVNILITTQNTVFNGHGIELRTCTLYCIGEKFTLRETASAV